MACKQGQFDVVEFKTFSINWNAQHGNGMTPFDLALKYGYQILQSSKSGNFQWNVVGRTLLEH